MGASHGRGASNRRKATILLVGLDGAGKTTILSNLTGECLDDIVPTYGFSRADLRLNGCDLTLYDLGGGKSIRDIWRKYYAEAHGFIFVVDSKNDYRFEEAGIELAKMMRSSKVIGKPLLLLTNKQDCVAVWSNSQIWEALNVEQVMGRNFHLAQMRKCSAMRRGFRGKGNPSIVTGLKWLIRSIHFHYSELSSRIESDVAIQLAEEKQKKAEKLARLQGKQIEREPSDLEVIVAESEPIPRQRVVPEPPRVPVPDVFVVSSITADTSGSVPTTDDTQQQQQQQQQAVEQEAEKSCREEEGRKVAQQGVQVVKEVPKVIVVEVEVEAREEEEEKGKEVQDVMGVPVVKVEGEDEKEEGKGEDEKETGALQAANATGDITSSLSESSLTTVTDYSGSISPSPSDALHLSVNGKGILPKGATPVAIGTISSPLSNDAATGELTASWDPLVEKKKKKKKGRTKKITSFLGRLKKKQVEKKSISPTPPCPLDLEGPPPPKHSWGPNLGLSEKKSKVEEPEILSMPKRSLPPLNVNHVDLPGLVDVPFHLPGDIHISPDLIECREVPSSYTGAASRPITQVF